MTMPCKICGGSTEPWLEMPFDPIKREVFGEGKVAFCASCSLGSLDPLPSQDVVSAAYELDRYYTQGESHIPDIPHSLADKVLTKFVHAFDRGDIMTAERVVASAPGSRRALDIGSGGGDVLEAYHRLGLETFGVEPDCDATSLSPDNQITVLQGRAEELPESLLDLEFDIVSMRHVLEHCLDPGSALEGARRVLKPGGLFWCEVPNSACLHFKEFTVASGMYDAPRHLHFFDDRSLSHILRAHGFEVTSFYYHAFTRHHLPGWRSWELGIADQLQNRRPEIDVKRHTFARSVALALRTVIAPARLKYDCVGTVAIAV